ncbi:uncharacterized protein LOC108678968 [Hyalella azteca]|uniref:Uncharacterized protein LOC108678968 n=1 Tax=Hyalella azteca TaxID=294128 RepID=A0A8B7PAF2_HYAAZ|nr:uncharacterized protein LOC108678968 [Hyalella azteca]
MHLRVFAAVLVLVLVKEGLCRYKEWMPVAADPAVLFNLKVQKNSRALASRLRCWNWASTKDWAFIACYVPSVDGSGNCTIMDDKPIRNGYVKRTIVQGSTNCTAVFKTDACVLPGNSSMKVGETRPNSYCPNLLDVCSSSGMLDIYKKTQPLQNCTSPFKVSGSKCLMVSSVLRTWCSAREFCLSSGGDLASARSDQDFNQLRTFYTASGFTGQWVWIGAYKTNGQWVWLNSDRDPYKLPDWEAGQPNNEDCLLLFNPDVKLGDYWCSSASASLMCEATLSP